MLILLASDTALHVAGQAQERSAARPLVTLVRVPNAPKPVPRQGQGQGRGQGVRCGECSFKMKWVHRSTRCNDVDDR